MVKWHLYALKTGLPGVEHTVHLKWFQRTYDYIQMELQVESCSLWSLWLIKMHAYQVSCILHFSSYIL